MIQIAVMEYSDVEYAKSLTDIEQWGHQEDDFKRLLQLDPEGSFVAWQSDNRVGIATTVSYNGYAFLGNIIVDKKRRGKNIGPALMQHAVDYLDKKGIKTIELDGVLSAVAMYRHMGFRDKYRSLRLARNPTRSKSGPAVFSQCGESAHMLAEFDYRKTGIQRKALISNLVQEFPAGTFCLTTPYLRAYTVIRERANGALAIGPSIAEDPAAFDAIMAGVVTVFGNRKMTVGVPETNTAAVESMLRYDFHYFPPSLRMYRGQRIAYENHIYGIVSADVG